MHGETILKFLLLAMQFSKLRGRGTVGYGVLIIFFWMLSFCFLGDIRDLSKSTSTIILLISWLICKNCSLNFDIFVNLIKNNVLGVEICAFSDQLFIGCRWTQVHETYIKIELESSTLGNFSERGWKVAIFEGGHAKIPKFWRYFLSHWQKCQSLRNYFCI